MKENIMKQLDVVLNKRFMIMMIDVWDDEDKKLYDEYTRQIRELRTKLAELD